MEPQRRPAGPRVAVALDGDRAPRWVDAILQSLDADEDVDWVVTFVVPRSGRSRLRRPPLAVRLYTHVDRRHESRRRDNVLERCDVSVMMARRAIVQFGASTGWPSDSTPSAFGVDVLLDLRDSSEPLPAADGPRETWSVELSEVERGARVPPLFWALANEVRTCEVRLVVERPAGREVAAASTVSVSPGALMYSQDGAYRRATEMVRRHLRARCDRAAAPAGSQSTSDQLPSPFVSAAGRSATLAVLGIATRRLARMVRLSIESRTRRSQWILGLRALTERSQPGNGDGFTPMLPPPDRSYADPFLVADGDNLFVFYERWPVRPGGKGVIEVMDVNRDGSVSAPRVVVERDYHLSYPFVFREGSAWYMIPETGAKRRIELYRARCFPDEWEFDRVLMSDVGARDATLLRTNGKYWLFSTIEGPGGGDRDELHLFGSDSLTGAWKAHPLNPIVSDVRCARPAGPIFEHDGRLIRPAQDCSARYGGAIVFREILKLDEHQYAEQTFAVQQPTWAPGLRATHHYSRASAMEVVDGAHMIKVAGRPVPR
jgi:hypothetical protein